MAGGAKRCQGTHSRLWDPKFSNLDWVAVQHAKELSINAKGPDDLQLVFAEGDSPFALSEQKLEWIREGALRLP